jgi:hypothetical protein
LIVDGASYQSSTGMAETLMGPEDLAGGFCMRGTAFVALGRSQSVQSSRLWLVVGEGLSVVWTGSGLDRIASEVSDLVRRAPFAFGRASLCSR